MQNQSKFISMASLLMAMILWASSFVAAKMAFQIYDPMVVVFGRMVVASCCFPLFIRYFKRTVRFRKQDLKYLMGMAICEPCLYFIFEAKAIENTTASQAGMITAILPLLVAGAAYIFLKEHITRKALVGFVIAIFGVCWLSVGGEATETAPNPLLGNFLEFLAMACAAGYTVILKRLTLFYSPFFLTAIQPLIGSVFFLPFLFLPSTTLPTQFETMPVLAIVYLGTFISLGAYGFFNFGVSRIPANQASAFTNLIPVFTIIMGWLVLGEKFTLSQYIASSLVFAGVIMSQEKPEPQKDIPLTMIPKTADKIVH